MSKQDNEGEADEKRIWLEAFQESQRQMASAHAAYQAAMTRSHQAFMQAIAESQSQLAAVLEGKLSPAEFASVMESIPDFGDAPLAEGSEADAQKRRVGVAVEAEPPGEPFDGLEGAYLVRDEMGVADALVALLSARGVELHAVDRASDVPDTCSRLIYLGGIADFRTVEDAMAAVRDGARLMTRLPLLRGGSLVVACDIGGRFGLDMCEAVKAPSAGLFAIAEVLRTAWPNATIKAIDLDVGYRKPDEVAQQLARELLTGGDEFVGLPEGSRVVRRDIARELKAESPFDFGGVVVVSASDSPASLALLEGFEAWPDARLVIVGRNEARERIGAAIGTRDYAWVPLESGDVLGFLEAMDEARREMGAFGAMLHANVGGDETLERLDSVLARRVSLMQVLLAATAADPIRRIGVITERNACAASRVADAMLTKMAIAEKERRGDECLVKALALHDIAQALPDVWREMSVEGDDVDIVLG